MIRSFKCWRTAALYRGDAVAEFVAVRTVALRKLDMLVAAERLNDLMAPPGNRLEALRGDRKGRYSIGINDRWRICFVWNDGADEVEIVDYH
jgi:toxin HigB-1